MGNLNGMVWYGTRGSLFAIFDDDEAMASALPVRYWTQLRAKRTERGTGTKGSRRGRALSPGWYGKGGEVCGSRCRRRVEVSRSLFQSILMESCIIGETASGQPGWLRLEVSKNNLNNKTGRNMSACLPGRRMGPFLQQHDVQCERWSDGGRIGQDTPNTGRDRSWMRRHTADVWGLGGSRSINGVPCFLGSGWLDLFNSGVSAGVSLWVRDEGSGTRGLD
ncbi:hypothetical protein B0T20DRAFT_395102 [Sordaria brevicollis]|uniref:Uncharacterized protein n=1 Tax=Sordaria brevicollis TaxID=83679 RepID=A0AAE0PAW9_SORBR|nr:hypothetical protein B0T20DRAFT_395102 [Sordaria brevicollis]